MGRSGNKQRKAKQSKKEINCMKNGKEFKGRKLKKIQS
jgi:hypothetical protein